jgi:hypothetical protein
MEPFSLAILGAMALGASCGLRIFVAPFVLSLMIALGALEADRISLLQSPWVTCVALGLLLMELGADKIGGLDQALDAAGLVMRPLWAVGLVLAVAPAGAPVAMAAVSACLLALFASAGKARLRIELRQLCVGEGAASAVAPLLSLVEDVIVAGVVLGAVVFAPVGFGLMLSVAFVWHLAAAVASRWRWQRWTGDPV